MWSNYASHHTNYLFNSTMSTIPTLTPLQKKLADILAAKKAAASAPRITLDSPEVAESINESGNILTIPPIPSIPLAGTDRNGATITYNPAQAEAINLISSGQSCVVIGAAGTGKTTIQKGSTQALIQNNSLGRVGASDHKYLSKDAYGIIICAFTRRATNNIRKNLPEDLQKSCITIHKALEYQPVEETTVDPVTGKERTTKPFRPTRNQLNPLPPTITTVIIEEASMVSTQLFKELLDALPHNPQFVFLGDIQQLPPVFGSAILGYKMLELPVVELTEVYRQALESPILSLAHRILSGKPLVTDELKSMGIPGKLTLHPWQKKISADSATITLAKFFIKAIEQNKYDPETDAILIPFNKACGSLELNKHLATKLSQKYHRSVYEIIHGFKRSYYSIGDKCLYDKEDAIITDIQTNPKYTGISPCNPSLTLDYWGVDKSNGSRDAIDMDQFLENVQIGEDGEDKKARAASHVVTLNLLDSDRTIEIQSSGELDSLDLGYAITVHKSQGSEWAKVFLCFHHSHATMIQRELLYTAVTRAKEELFCICESDTFEKGIIRQRIKGSTWQEKAEYFKGKIENNEEQS